MNPRYQEWTRYIFDHEIRDPAWYFDLHAPKFVATLTEYADLLCLTFSRSGEDLTA